MTPTNPLSFHFMSPPPGLPCRVSEDPLFPGLHILLLRIITKPPRPPASAMFRQYLGLRRHPAGLNRLDCLLQPAMKRVSCFGYPWDQTKRMAPAFILQIKLKVPRQNIFELPKPACPINKFS